MQNINIGNLGRILGKTLKRNLGIDIENITNVRTDKITSMLGILELTHENKITKIPVYGDENPLESFLDVSVFKTIIRESEKNSRLEFVWQHAPPLEDFKIFPDEFNVTNFHALLKNKGENYHFKVFSNFENCKKELYITELLADKGLYPFIHGFVKIDGNPFIIIWKRISYARNCDDILGSIYAGYFAIDDIFKQFSTSLDNIFDSLIDTLLKFWSIVSEINVDTKENYWIEKLENDYRILKKSNIYQEKLDKIFQNTKYWLERQEMNIIHGDVWLRQFIRSEDSYVLGDLEDITKGPLFYDIAGLYNSILQQAVYFSREYPHRRNNEDHLVEHAKNKFIEILNKKIKYDNLVINLKYGSFLRGFHELAYLIQHQPGERWLISFIVDELLEEL